MFLSAVDRKTRHEARKYVVIDKDTGERIPRVIWVNEETGRYRQYLLDEKGFKHFDPKTGKVATKFSRATLN